VKCVSERAVGDIGIGPYQGRILHGSSVNMEVCLVSDVAQLGSDRLQIINVDVTCLGGVFCRVRIASDDVPEGASFFVVVKNADGIWRPGANTEGI